MFGGLKCLDLVAVSCFRLIILIGVIMQNLDDKTVKENKRDWDSLPQDEKDKIVRSFEENLKKTISFKELNPSLKIEVDKIIKEFNSFKDEIDQYNGTILDLQKLLDYNIASLVKTGKFKESKNFDDRNKEVIQGYLDFLEKVKDGVSGDISFYSKLISDEPEKSITVFKWESDSLEEALIPRIKKCKREIKRLNKDVKIIQSRHRLRLESAIKDLEYTQIYLNHQKHTETH